MADKIWTGYTGLGNHSFRVWKRRPSDDRKIVELTEYHVADSRQPYSDREFMERLYSSDFETQEINKRLGLWVMLSYNLATEGL